MNSPCCCLTEKTKSDGRINQTRHIETNDESRDGPSLHQICIDDEQPGKGTRVRKPIRPRTMGNVTTSSTSFDVAIKHMLAKKKRRKQIEQDGGERSPPHFSREFGCANPLLSAQSTQRPKVGDTLTSFIYSSLVRRLMLLNTSAKFIIRIDFCPVVRDSRRKNEGAGAPFYPFASGALKTAF